MTSCQCVIDGQISSKNNCILLSLPGIQLVGWNSGKIVLNIEIQAKLSLAKPEESVFQMFEKKNCSIIEWYSIQTLLNEHFGLVFEWQTKSNRKNTTMLTIESRYVGWGVPYLRTMLKSQSNVQWGLEFWTLEIQTYSKSEPFFVPFLNGRPFENQTFENRPS